MNTYLPINNRILPFTIALLIAFISMPFALAEIPESTKAALKKNAPEQLKLKILSVERKVDKNGSHVELIAKAEVIAVIKSKNTLKKGDQITIAYTTPNFKAPGVTPSGSYSREILKNETCMAYLKLATKKGLFSHVTNQKKLVGKVIFVPAASSGSFN